VIAELSPAKHREGRHPAHHNNQQTSEQAMKETDEITTSRPPTHYVGIGASAGGLEAIESFFTNMPARSNLAFIVVQHLSPDYKSLMVELLSKKTEMKVNRAEEGMEVKPGNVYLIPPKKNLSIFHGKLLLKDRSDHEGISLPIDIFLQSLAEDQGSRAIAIILSGTGSDGARGVRAIKEHNGMVMVQDEQTAKFDGMPRAAISTGTADFILPPDRMPHELLAYIAHPYISGEKPADALLEDADALTRLFAELRAKTKVDFTYYKPSTISRRIERRMSINQINNFDDYVRYLQHYPGEVMALYRELLIGVTSFFRDPDAMEELRSRILPGLVERAQNREVRCWVAGCSSGEEAYTLAILFREVMAEHELNRDVKIFATDVDRDAILRASNGMYPESIAADLTPRILGKYFYHREDSYQVTRTIREMVVFAQHNLVNDPPFTNIDLVSCRNLLIYLQPVLQVKALEMFNFSLNRKGCLFLGNSETVGDLTDYFKPLHQRFRIYESRGRNQSLHHDELQVSGRGQGRYQFKRSAAGYRTGRDRDGDGELSLLRQYLVVAAERYLPLSVIVNEQLEVIHIVGNTEGYFSVPSGPAEYNITKLAARELAIPLATGIQKVFRTGEEISYSNVRIQHRGEKRSLRMHLALLPQRKSQEPLVAVFLEDSGRESSPVREGAEVYDLNEDAQQRIRDLEQELQFSQENLQATIEELETSNEELQATNEELLASNEELQSTNEELQSTNEELYTVNAEHQKRIIELTELSNDVDNLMTSSGIGTLIIDENLEIRKYSPEIAKIFHILEKDIGRPFTHISHRLADFDPLAAVGQVQRTNEPLETHVETRDGRWYLTRILPYHIGPETYSGVVLTFVDITELRTVRNDLRRSELVAHDLSENIPVGLLVYRLDESDRFVLESGNPEAERLIGFAIGDWLGSRFEDIWPASEQHDFIDCFKKVVETGETCVLDRIRYQDERVAGEFYVNAFRIPDNRLVVSFKKYARQSAPAGQHCEEPDL
jgi:two-component system, chemotaxis family, CheB/CheR fusion protein